jgi:hypothetical protein
LPWGARQVVAAALRRFDDLIALSSSRLAVGAQAWVRHIQHCEYEFIYNATDTV